MLDRSIEARAFWVPEVYRLTSTKPNSVDLEPHRYSQIPTRLLAPLKRPVHRVLSFRSISYFALN
jgi:hypothetical protein